MTSPHDARAGEARPRRGPGAQFKERQRRYRTIEMRLSGKCSAKRDVRAHRGHIQKIKHY